MGLIRYPGSKERLVKQIIGRFPYEMSTPLWMDHNAWEYREPFFGAGAIGLQILRLLPPSCSAWINDIDYWLICLWQTVWRDPKRLCEKINDFTPSTEAFFNFKKRDGDHDTDPIQAGFGKLVLHQTGFSGLGVKAGGPLGGRNQDNRLYSVDCRWSPEHLISDVLSIHEVLSRIRNLRITCRDFSELIGNNPKVFLYLDPPYYEKGPELYKHYLSENDHKRLANLLHQTNSKWILSYDDHPEIRSLYSSFAEFQPIEVIYTTAKTNTPHRPKNQEVLIMPKANGVTGKRADGR